MARRFNRKDKPMRDQTLNFNFSLDELNAELDRRLNILTGASPNADIETYNKLHADQAELTRRSLVIRYGITLDEFDNYATIAHAAQLRVDALKAVCNTLGQTAQHLELYGGTGDDGSDYLNACSDQLAILADLNAQFDDNETERRILAIINITDHPFDGDDEAHQDAQAFQYGYADHASPISALAAFTYKD